MPTYEIYGKEVEFQKAPTHADIDEVGQQILSAQQADQQSSDLQNAALGMFGKESAQAPSPGKTWDQELFPSLHRGLLQGGENLAVTGVNAVELLRKLVGLSPTTKLGDYIKNFQNTINEVLPAPQTIPGKIAEGIGELPGLITTYENPLAEAAGVVPLAAGIGAINAQNEGPGGMISGGVKNAALMWLLKSAQGLQPIPGALAGAGTMGVATALGGGNQKDIISQSVLGGGYALFHPDVVSEIKGNIESAKTAMKDPKAWIAGLMKDDIQDLQNQYDQQEAQIKGERSGIGPQFADIQKEEIAKIQGGTEETRAAIESLKSEEQKRFEREQGLTQEEQAKSKQDRAMLQEKLTKEMYQTLGELPQKANEQAHFVQELLPEMGKEVSAQYSAEFNKTFERLSNSDQPMPPSDQQGIILSAQQRILKDTNNLDDSVFKKLKKLSEGKYAGSESNVNQQLADLGYSPETIAALERQNPDIKKLLGIKQPEGVPVKEFYRDMKNILDGASPQDHSASVLRKIIGDWIAQKDPEFKFLQRDYAHYVGMRGQLYRTFKPFDLGDVKPGELFFQKFGKGEKALITMAKADKDLLHFLESGFTGKKLKWEGMGDLSRDLLGIGKRIDMFKRSILDLKGRDFGVFGERLANLAQDHIKQLETLKGMNEEAILKEQQAIEGVKAKIQQETAKALMENDLKKQVLQGKRQALRKLDEDRKKIEGYANAFTMALTGLGQWRLGRLARGFLLAKRVPRVRSGV